VRTARRKRERRREDGWKAGAEAHPTCGDPEKSAVRNDLVRAALDVVDGLSALDKDAVARALDDGEAGDPAARKRRQRAFDRLRAAWRERYG
jgi:hypothetical protein